MLRTLTLPAIASGLLTGMLATATAQTPPAAPSPPPAVTLAHQPMAHPIPPRVWRLRHMMRTWALFDPDTDRKLTASDVQTIGQAFLLWHGNRTWKVADVAPQADGWIAFAFAAPDGTVIARFAMNPHNGHLRRLG